MQDMVVVKVEHVSKKFARHLRPSMWYGIQDIFRNLFRMSTRSEKLRADEFWAVNDVSFELKRGECLGIIGENGSGKSTLLKMLNGIFMPDTGKIEIRGRVGALIELGAGLHPLLTGRENIYVNSAILGMSKSETAEKYEDVVKFADIGDFLNTPVKFYSSGMLVRLAFAIAAHCNPDILLIDEVLSVGDENFRAKCVTKIKDFMNNGGSAIFISHSMPTIQGMSDRVMWLENSINKKIGVSEHIISEYVMHSLRKGSEIEPVLPSVEEISIKAVKIINRRHESSDFVYGDTIVIEIAYKACKQLINPSFDIVLQRDGDDTAIRLNLSHDYYDVTLEQNEEGIVSCVLHDVLLVPGTYDVLLSVILLPSSAMGKKVAFRKRWIGNIQMTGSSKVWERVAPVISNYPSYMPKHEWHIQRSIS
ncbi:polysaccharide ABC transporter ATP-binding protein [Chloroflexota bacterium]